jgi:hypothetical protein
VAKYQLSRPQRLRFYLDYVQRVSLARRDGATGTQAKGRRPWHNSRWKISHC